MSQLKLSSIKTSQTTAVELEKANKQIDELNRLLSAEKQASKSLALKLAEARINHEEHQSEDNEALHREIDKLKTAQQIMRLEGVVEQDAKARKLADQLKERTQELGEIKKTLKALQVFDPERQKRQLADQKKKIAEQTLLSKDLNAKLKASKREISELKKELNELKSVTEETPADVEAAPVSEG